MKKLKIAAILLITLTQIVQSNHVYAESNGFLESPANGTIKSGIGIVRGWHCDAQEITISFDGSDPIKVAYLNPRGDTQVVCGDINNGFELLVNWNLFNAGNHVLEVFADGKSFGKTHYETAPLSANEQFVTGLSRNKRINNFPTAGKYTDMSWSQADQNFIINHTGLMADNNTQEPAVGVVGDQQLDLIVNHIKNKYELPALAAVLVVGDDFVEKSAMGLRSINEQESVTSSDKWHVGSITKSMTATLAALLVKDGVLNWETTLQEVFPELTTVMKPEYRDIQLQELLSNTSGLPHLLSEVSNFDAYNSDNRDIKIQRLELLETVVAMNSTTMRGEYEYNNIGFIVAGAMLEKRTGESWEDLIKTRIFNPLLIKNGGFGAPDTQSITAQPVGHEWNNQWLAVDPSAVIADNPKIIGPAGTVHMSLADMAKYLKFHLNGLKGKSVDGMLNANEFSQLYTPQSTSGYALGWQVQNNEIFHDGSNGFWYAVLLINADENIGMFIVTNADIVRNTEIAVNELISKLVERLRAGAKK